MSGRTLKRLLTALLVSAMAASSLTGCSAPREVLPELQCPTAKQIQNDTRPPYGPSIGIGIARPGTTIPVSTVDAQRKGLGTLTTLNADYATVQNMYRMILLPWLVDTLGLAEFDQQLADFGIPAATGDDRPFDLVVQQCTGIKLAYLDIRNILYIERLEQAQINLFLEHANDPDFASNSELIDIVKDTYSRVYKVQDVDIPTLDTSFGGYPPFFPNDAIVVNLVYVHNWEEFDEEGHYNQLNDDRRFFVHRTVLPALEAHVTAVWPGKTAVLFDSIDIR